MHSVETFRDLQSEAVEWRRYLHQNPELDYRLHSTARFVTEKLASMSTPSIVIASAARTAVGFFNGAFTNTPPQELGAAVIEGVLERVGVDAGELDEIILGQALPAGEGRNPAHQAARSRCACKACEGRAKAS